MAVPYTFAGAVAPIPLSQLDANFAAVSPVLLGGAGVSGTLLPANGGTGLNSLGTGVATFLGTPTSANLAAAVTGETGTGALVFATSPTLATPVISGFREATTDIGTVVNSYQLSITSSTVLLATLTASQACVFAMPVASLAGQSFTLLLNQASGGSGSATFTGVKWNSSGAPTITVTASKRDILGFIYDGTNWYGTYSQGFTP